MIKTTMRPILLSILCLACANDYQTSLSASEISTERSQFRIETERLYLRQWKDEDVFALHAFMQDQKVTYYLQKHELDRLSNLQMIAEKSKKNISEHGYGYFVCEDKATGQIIGMMGLNYVDLPVEHFPCYTVSWILKRDCWGKGLANEAAHALIQYGFEVLDIPKIYACTTWNNEASLGVMRRLGMTFVQNFDFPGFEKDDLFCSHVLYIKERE